MLLWRFGESPGEKALSLYEFTDILTPTNLEGNKKLAGQDIELQGGFDKLEQSHYIFSPDPYNLIKGVNPHNRNQNP